jgi:CBS domain containing-hemolysin-like protein
VFVLFIAFVCVLANGFFVAAEFALARVRPTALEILARSGDLKAGHALGVISRIDVYLTAAQLGITLASLAIGWLGEPALAQLMGPPLRSAGLSDDAIHWVALTAAFAIISLLHVVIGEQVPKFLAILRPVTVVRLVSPPLTLFYYAFYPILMALTAFSNYLLKSAGLGEQEERQYQLSAEEIRLIMRASFKDSAKDGTKLELLERALRASDRPVRTRMVPRLDMVTLSLNADLNEWLKTFRKSGYSRYPVSEDGDPDKIAGYVYAKDLLLAESQPKGGVRKIKRDVLFVPETRPVGDVLVQFQRTGIPLAIVVDEYGGTSGLVTVKDVVEEFVGDLRDELDSDRPRVETREDGSIVVDGSMLLSEIPLEGLDRNAEVAGNTVGGFIISKLGRLARPGDRVRLLEYEATVEDVRRRRIGRVMFKRWTPSSTPAGSNGSSDESSAPKAS